MDFGPQYRLAITKSTIELTDPTGSSSLVKNRSRRSNRFENGVVVIYDNDRCNLPVVKIVLYT